MTTVQGFQNPCTSVSPSVKWDNSVPHTLLIEVKELQVTLIQAAPYQVVHAGSAREGPMSRAGHLLRIVRRAMH